MTPTGIPHAEAPSSSPNTPLDLYSPGRRTAVVLTGTGAAGAYHAGVLRALTEAGVKVDLVAGRGIGVVGALYAAIDGVGRLWDRAGIWRPAGLHDVYGWRPVYRWLGHGLVAGLVLCTLPGLVLVLAFVGYELALFVEAAGDGTAASVAGAYGQWLEAAFGPSGLPTWLPRLAMVLLAALGLLVVVAAWRARGRLAARRRQRGGFWWAALGSPLSAVSLIARAEAGLWELLRGGVPLRQPDRADLGRRYAELLAENLGQPGFRELLLVVHDLDARRDLVFALLGDAHRRPFFLRKPVMSGDRRSAEAFDLAGVARDHTLDALAAGLSLPVATDPHLVTFSPDGYWRGEAHRLCDRPDGLLRVLEEVAAAGVEQVIVVSAAPELTGPHMLTTRRVVPRARLGDALAASEAASLRDALHAAHVWFEAVFLVQPAHNPIGPLDFTGAWDERSDRWQPLRELVERGYEDAYRQFVDPVVGASGEALAPGGPAVTTVS